MIPIRTKINTKISNLAKQLFNKEYHNTIVDMGNRVHTQTMIIRTIQRQLCNETYKR